MNNGFLGFLCQTDGVATWKRPARINKLEGGGGGGTKLRGSDKLKYPACHGPLLNKDYVKTHWTPKALKASTPPRLDFSDAFDCPSGLSRLVMAAWLWRPLDPLYWVNIKLPTRLDEEFGLRRLKTSRTRVLESLQMWQNQ